MAKFWVGVTDNRWFRFLCDKGFDEINFWQPSGNIGFRALTPGDLFLFKLKKPFNHIGGGGYFVKYSKLPLSLAWDAFQAENGCESLLDMRNMIFSLRRDRSEPDPSIGCIILAAPFFFPEKLWIEAPLDWSQNLVRGKNYSTDTAEGAVLFEQVRERLNDVATTFRRPEKIEEEKERYGKEFLARARLGQGAFRVLVTDAYERRCAVTGEKTLPVLEAAHIRPFSASGPNSLNNGILLRSDFHILFDKGYLTISPDLRIEISKRIKEEWFNGRVYYSLHGSTLRNIPKHPGDRPLRAFLDWHNQNVYQE